MYMLLEDRRKGFGKMIDFGICETHGQKEIPGPFASKPAIKANVIVMSEEMFVDLWYLLHFLFS